MNTDSRFKFDDAVWDTRQEFGGIFLEAYDDGSCSISAGPSGVYRAFLADLITAEEWQRQKAERLKNAPTWDDLLNE